MTSRIELYVSKKKLKLRCHAFGYIIGHDRPNNGWLALQLAQRVPQITPQQQPRAIRINSRFDYNNSLYKVISATADGIQALCLWGDSQGQTVLFADIEEVVQLVNEKRG
jgi:hypothetical protein